MKPDPCVSTASLPRPSACPGLWRIVSALDGGICRVKLPGGRLSSAQARAVAGAARLCASGVLELTNRSNLQVRGVREEAHAALVQHLLAAGLGPRHAAADDVRNLLLSPAAGRDPAALLDTRPLAEQLLALLQDTPQFHGLSAKFALQLDGGETLAMLDHPHDLWLSALPGGTQLAVGLAGCPRDPALGVVEVEQAPLVVAAILRLFLELAGEHSRMRQLLAELPVADFIARLPFSLDRDVPLPARPETAVVPLGMHPQAQASLVMLLAGAPLGRLEAVQLWALADLAEAEGSGELRLTPWQSVLLPDIPVARQEAVAAALGEIGLLLDAREPLSQLLACSGSAACAKGLADTKADARHLAERLRAGHVQPQVHLSGCPRSCAAAHTAPFTLLAQPGGRYQLYQRAAGVAGFGRLLAPSLSIEEAGAWFAALPASGTSA
ncbi:precorrin-3B synthase [Aquipseudomonas guryensis]|uniref:Precorrin-3B synthase n=1 Tax=Aquipseudomonas guryensis TaxID=2759165 RepID=A0A7W4DB09_9GAMM|nr:precorrin-3B synthase [Pseudomonas guryensis]